jgi:hypothetical protein
LNGPFAGATEKYPDMTRQQFFPSMSSGVVFNPLDERVRPVLKWVLLATVAGVIELVLKILFESDLRKLLGR